MILEALEGLTVKRQGQLIPWPKGHVMQWSNEEGHKLLQRADDILRIVEAGAHGQESQVTQSVAPSEWCPLKGGWDVVYRGEQGRLESGVIQTVQSASRGWRLDLDNGHIISSSVILSVGRRENGKLVAMWLVGAHGLDGTREQPCPPSGHWEAF